jgi:oxygen-independent coproporphyrinogen III oxidase
MAQFMSASFFDPELIRRYNINGPRYTSYPTADQFRDGDWIDAYSSSLVKTDIRALSLYIHVPFCSTICFYCACNKINTANLKRSDSYVQRLVREMELQSRRIDRPHRVEQLHFGGGTPTFLNDDQFATVFEAMHDYFNLADDDARDFSIEIDPRNLSTHRIDNLAKLGFNRISMGVQDFDPVVQVAVNRIQSVAETRAIINAARENSIGSINIDLINGLPKQSLKGFTKTLEQVIELDPDRLSLYSYAHLPQRFKTQRQINSADLPDADTKLQLLEMAVHMLADAGYDYIGMDHFAKSSDSLISAQKQGTLHRNFQGYTTHGHCELVGLGVSSIGNVGPVYVQNAKTLHDYYQAIDAGQLAIVRGFKSDNQDAIIGQVIQDLMCRFTVDFAEFRSRTGYIFEEYFAERWPALLRFQNDGLLTVDPNKITVTEKGRYLVRIICMAFDAYIHGDTEKFSKAI